MVLTKKIIFDKFKLIFSFISTNNSCIIYSFSNFIVVILNFLVYLVKLRENDKYSFK